MHYFFKHRLRIAVTLIPLVLALLHALGVFKLSLVERLEAIAYDTRLVAAMPNTLDERIVIVDLDEKSLAEVGRWPWSRNRLADLMNELFDRQKIAVVGFDVVFSEPDDSSGLTRLKSLAQNELRDQAGYADRLAQLQASLDYDGLFARAIANRPVALGYYLSSDRQGRTSGRLPAPVFDKQAMQGRQAREAAWDGYGSNIDRLAQAAPLAGFFNTLEEADGVVRSVPLVTELKGSYYESLSLVVFRLFAGLPSVAPGFPAGSRADDVYQGLESIQLRQGKQAMRIPVDDRLAVLVPYRGVGGPDGGSFRYVSAADLLAKRLPEASLAGKIVLVGTTAPGLLDLRSTPVGNSYPGVEAHANIISGLLDDKNLVRPDYAVGFEVAMLLLAGLLLAFVLPALSALTAVLLSTATIAAMVGLNFWMFASAGLVFPLALMVIMTVTAFVVNMSYGYLVESRSKRDLAQLFGTYVPPELVKEMVKDPESYSMKASSRELTVMFCDMRGFTSLSENLKPLELQAMLNGVFSQLTSVIRRNMGTIDKYMGDCVMAFWGAPVETAQHAQLAVKTALEMTVALRRINEGHRAKGLAEISLGVGLNTGSMCVGDMGSDIRRSYTVIGDAVNLGSRLEGLSKVYGVDTVVSESTRALAPDFVWQELDRVRVKGKAQAVAIFWPAATAADSTPALASEMATWAQFLEAYRDQRWTDCDPLLAQLRIDQPTKSLYQLYEERLALRRTLPQDPDWDGATNFETK
jgi:adenylate cyclase